MSEKRTKCHSCRVEYVCDKCGKGMMETTAGISLTSNPPKYQHTCTHCGHQDYFTKAYPGFILAVSPPEAEK
jgi:hypothetical protein